MATPEATCYGCGCTDSRACAVGCFWLSVERGMRIGVCSCCSRFLPRFEECVEAVRNGSSPDVFDREVPL